jgi:outer membrane receptor protein involved in Fe transport
MGRPKGLTMRKSGDRPEAILLAQLSREELGMRIYIGLLATFSTFSACLLAADVKGTVVDPSGAPVGGAQVSIMSRVGLEARTVTSAAGTFEFESPDIPDAHLVVTAPGFRTATLPLAAAVTVKLAIAPQVDSVGVAGSTVDVAASQQGSSVDIVPREEIRTRNEPYAMDLLRDLPGMEFNQTGSPGGVSSLFLRGGDSNFTLVQIDGAPVNAFGGGFDFAHIPSEALDQIDVIRGPQSAIYGSYANSGVVNFITRQPGAAPQFDVLAEGGTYDEHRFAITASDTVAGFGILASASRVDDNGPVQNSDYHNQDALLNISRRFGNQSFSLHALFDYNNVGEPGPYGSDPLDDFTGIDTISRSKNNSGEYGGHYEIDLSGRVREELFGSFFMQNSGYTSPYGFSYDQDLRGQGETRTVVSVTRHYVASFGFVAGREDVKNTYISDANYEVFPIKRSDFAAYLENRFEFGGKLFLNIGARAEWILTPSIPTDGYSRPFFPANTVSRVNPKLSAAYVPTKNTRIHTSFGTGIRPPTGFELAFTDNPQLKPERTRSVDAGIEQTLFHDLLRVGATYFYNRYYDLIVTLGGSLAALSHYESANLANSRAEGAEFSATLRPARSLYLTGSYTLLGTRILSLDGTTNTAPLPFQVGQELTRRPENSGSVVAAYARGRVTAGINGYFRGKTLYEEPTYGATDGLYWNPGFANVGINLNYALGHGVTVYGNLRNALDRHYEEVFGYPSPRLNFVAGMKFSISRAKAK